MSQELFDHGSFEEPENPLPGAHRGQRGTLGILARRLAYAMLCIFMLGFVISKYFDYKLEKWRSEVAAVRQLLPGIERSAVELSKALENEAPPEGLPQTIEYPALLYTHNFVLGDDSPNAYKLDGPKYLTGDTAQSFVSLGKDATFFQDTLDYDGQPIVDISRVKTIIIVQHDDQCGSYDYKSVTGVEGQTLLLVCTDRVFVISKDTGKITAYRRFEPGSPPQHMSGNDDEVRVNQFEQELDWFKSLPAPRLGSLASESK